MPANPSRPWLQHPRSGTRSLTASAPPSLTFTLPSLGSFNITRSLLSSHLQPTSITVWSFPPFRSLSRPSYPSGSYLARLPTSSSPACPSHPCNTLRHREPPLMRAKRLCIPPRLSRKFLFSRRHSSISPISGSTARRELYSRKRSIRFVASYGTPQLPLEKKRVLGK